MFKLKKTFQKTLSSALAAVLTLSLGAAPLSAFAVDPTELLTEPYLQYAQDTSVYVVWYTETEGSINQVMLYENGESEGVTRTLDATTTQMSRMRQDISGAMTDRDIYRHEALVSDLPLFYDDSDKVPYSVTSDSVTSDIYTLQANAQEGTDMNILFTSDSQLKNMTAANMQKIVDEFGEGYIDAIFFAGDLVNVPDAANEWFDDAGGGAFFPSLQGTASKELDGVTYTGGAIAQYAPLYSAIGNHEVMGRYDVGKSTVSAEFNDPTTVAYAEALYERDKATINPTDDPAIKEAFIQDNSFNTVSYEELFTLPESEDGGERYYATTVGDVRLVTLEITRIWRNNAVGSASKYSEPLGVTDELDSSRGFGTHIFESIEMGSEQYNWLVGELNSSEFQDAEYKIIMFHHQFHSLGGNVIPAYTDPVEETISVDPDGDGTFEDLIIYTYPLEDDQMVGIEPLLEAANVDLILNGHSHLWNRFETESGMNILETSNVGNTYNAFLDTKSRTGSAPSAFSTTNAYNDYASYWDADDYVLQGDPYGLSPVMPTNPYEDNPYIMSNTVTAFTIFNTSSGMVDSYYYDTTDADSDVIKFDTFDIRKESTEISDPSGDLKKVAGYSTGYSSEDGGVAEIVAYNSDNESIYLVNGKEQMIDIVSLESVTGATLNQTLSQTKRIDVTNMISGFTVADITSISVNTENKLVAVAVQADSYTANGRVLLLDYEGNYVADYEVGVQPDMVTFSTDGRYVLTANEGEPRDGYTAPAVDPKGSVTIIDLSADTVTPNTVTFDAWDAQREALVSENVLIKTGMNPSTDFEPEYIVISADSTKAYVALQEANAIATLDIASASFTDISSLGFKNHKIDGNEIDVVKDDEIDIKWENLHGVYMPDGISIYETGGKTYLLTANEGDASEWGDYINEIEIQIEGEDVKVLDKSVMDGLPTGGEFKDSDNFIFGARSFSIYEVSDSGLTQVFDSGSDFEKITAEMFPDNFNASNDDNDTDDRSDNKGPEPENVTVQTIGSNTYAYIGLERIGGVMMYDITVPQNAVFVDYINTRDFSVDFLDKDELPVGVGSDETVQATQGDISVEGIVAVSDDNSPTGKPLVITANEVSGTIAVYQQGELNATPSTGNSSSSGSGTSSDIDTEISSGDDIDSADLQNIIDEGESLTVAGQENVSVTFDTEAIEAILAAAGTEDVKIEVAEVDSNTLTDSQKELVGSRPVYEFTILAGDTEITAFGDGAVEVSIPYALQDGETAEGLVVWYLADDNTIEKIPCTYSDGILKFTTKHFSLYVVAYETPATSGFDDVATDAWYFDAVSYAVSEGLFTGTSDNSFSPDTAMTRAMLWTVLARMEGIDTQGGDSWYTKGMEWAVSTGISDGTNPDGNITREELSTMLYRYAQSPAITAVELPFADAENIADWSYDAMLWAVSKQIISGMTQTEIQPQGEATRAQVATILMRYTQD